MVDWVVLLDRPRGFQSKMVQVYLEDDNGAHRQIEQVVSISVDVDSYLTNNFDAVWALALPLSDDVWDSASETRYRSLYREVVRAGVNAAKAQGSTLANVTTAISDVIAASDKSGAYNKIVSLANGATAGERDALFAIVSFLVLNQFLADD